MTRQNKETLIALHQITKEYRMGEVTVKAAGGISFEVEKGEFVVALGPSGSGKSTVLNMIGGMDKPSSGEIWVAGKNISEFSDREMTEYRRKAIGFVFQFYNLMPNLTARENVELAAEVSENPMNIDEVMEAVGLHDRMNNFPAQLSGGQQQRVAIARAVVKNPLLLLCDEPTGALDYATGKTILRLLHDVNRKLNRTVVLISHNTPIAAMADKVIKIKSGLVESIVLNKNPQPIEGIEW